MIKKSNKKEFIRPDFYRRTALLFAVRESKKSNKEKNFWLLAEGKKKKFEIRKMVNYNSW